MKHLIYDLARNNEQFESVMKRFAIYFIDSAPAVDTGHWQSLKDVPHTKTKEIQNFSVALQIPATSGSWAEVVRPNLPWAEDHFLERVEPDYENLNPGVQFKNWPWYRGGVEDHKQQGQFSHTYMERIWPKWAGPDGDPERPHIGIRYKYGDLNDLLALLSREPYTRQAYLPIWFPEDIHAAAVEHERVPCTLGWHFMLRDGQLHCFYPMRSVDFVRYLRDDLYMAGRLVQHIIKQLRDLNGHEVGEGDWVSPWDEVEPGTLTLFASSCHIFEGDIPKLRREYEI